MTASPGPSKSQRLKALFASAETTLMPFGVLPIHAQMAEKAGFEAFEISGGMTSWWIGGAADVGLMTLTEMTQHAARVARSVDIPVYCDADTGYGGVMNVRRTVHEFIWSGIAGIHLEDQEEPKKAGGQSGIALVSDAEAIGRFNAATDARDELDEDFVVVARTDGYGAAGGGLREAIRRGQLYRKESAVDVIFYEGLHTWDEVRIALSETDGPAYAIPSQRAGRHPSVAEMTAMGQSIDIVPFLLPGVHDVWQLLLAVRDAGEQSPIDDYLAKVAAAQGTEGYVGWGDVFIRPDYQQVRAAEEKYLPPEKQRDYDNNLNS